MRRLVLALLGLIPFLAGCGVGSGPYSQKDGKWLFEKDLVPVPAGETLTPLNNRFAKSKTMAFFRASPIEGADAGSFKALSDRYAKDRSHVWYADTFRKGQEYYTVVHTRVVALVGAEPASFVILDSADASTALGYAKDKAHVWFEGELFEGTDAATFAPLRGAFARDAVQGYFARAPIPGADGRTFEAIDDSWSKDAAHVWWSDVDLGSDPPGALVNRLAEGADPGTFQVLDGGYGKDAAHVFHQGKLVDGADPATFEVGQGSWAGDAHDKSGGFRAGERTRAADLPPIP